MNLPHRARAAARRFVSRPGRSERDRSLIVSVDEVVHFRGHAWVGGFAFHPDAVVTGLAYVLPGDQPVDVDGWARPSPDLVEAHGPAAATSRFALELREGDPRRVAGLALVFTLSTGARVVVDDLGAAILRDDPYHRLVNRFFERMQATDGATVLEIGSRNRSGNVRRGLTGDTASYVGFDVREGDNVDVVGDAHDLSAIFDHDRFDAVFSISTFEHLAMPWKVAVEINRVMKPGGILLVATHQTWPLHEEPWDFWRFSEHSWPALFNPRTGYEILEAAMGERAAIVAHALHPPTIGLTDQPARLASAVLCRKVGPAEVDWEVAVSDVIRTAYPQ